MITGVTISVNSVDETLVDTQCDFCGKPNLPITVPTEPFHLWLEERIKFIQDAMPDLSIRSREKLISGMCDQCDKAIDETAEKIEERLREWND